MTQVITKPTIEETLSVLSQRLYRVEQLVSSPTIGSGSGGSGIGSNPDVGTITIGGIVVRPESSPPTGLSLVTGSFMEDIWIDASWTPPSDGSAVEYDVELARKVAGVYELVQAFRTAGTNLRMAGLEPQTTYGVRVASINRIARRSVLLPSSGFQDITTSIDATTPSQVLNVVAAAGFRTITLRWNEVPERDVVRGTGQYRIDLATDSGFTTNLVTQYTTGTIIAFADLTTGTTYYARVRAIDNSGNAGPYSSTVSATTAQVGNPDIAALSIGTAQIQDAAILNAKIADATIDNAKIATLDAAKINTGTLSANRIAANSLDVEKLASGSMSTVNLTITGSGAIKVNNPPTTGLLINSQGLRLYSGSVAKVILDNNGNATFTGNVDASTVTGGTISGTSITGGTISGGAISGGTIDATTITGTTINGGNIIGATVKTAATGQRVAFEAGVISKLKFYSGNNQESAPGEMNVGVSATPSLEVGLYAPKIASQYYAGLRAASTNTVGGEGFLELNIFNDTGAGRGRIYLHGSATAGSTCDIADWNLVRVWVENSRWDFFEYNDVSAVLTLKSPNGNTGGITVYNGSSDRVFVSNGAGSGTTGIEAAAYYTTSAGQGKQVLGEAPSVDLDRLRVVRYRRVSEEDKAVHWGLLAEDVASVFPEAVARDEGGTPSSISLTTLVAMLIKAVQDLRKKVK